MGKESELNNILLDNTSGSNELLLKLNSWMIKYYPNYSPPQQIIDKIKHKLMEFQAVLSYLDLIIAQTDYKKFIEDFSLYLNELNSILIKNALEHLKSVNKIVTISNSFTLYSVFLAFAKTNPDLEIFVCESRPINEGIILAKKLADYDIKVTIITEAMIAQFVSDVDCVLLGADKILKNGAVINKVGSKLLAVTAKHYKKPVYVIADKLKFSENDSFEKQIHPSEEICKLPGKNILIPNFYFESIERELITKIISN